MKRNPDESIDNFIAKFETAEAKLKAVSKGLDQELLAIQLLESVNVDALQDKI